MEVTKIIDFVHSTRYCSVCVEKVNDSVEMLLGHKGGLTSVVLCPTCRKHLQQALNGLKVDELRAGRHND